MGGIVAPGVLDFQVALVQPAIMTYDLCEQAARRQLGRSKKLFEDWKVIALGWRDMRNDVVARLRNRSGGSEQKILDSQAYRSGIAGVLELHPATNGLLSDKYVRNALLHLAENLDDANAWWETLGRGERAHFTTPRTFWKEIKKWQAAQNGPGQAATPRPKKRRLDDEPATLAEAKQMLRSAARTIREKDDRISEIEEERAGPTGRDLATTIIEDYAPDYIRETVRKLLLHLRAQRKAKPHNPS